MHLKILILLLVTVFYAVSCRLVKPDTSFNDAEQFQGMFDKLIKDKARESLFHLFTKDFYYIGCDGRKYTWPRYTEMALDAPYPRRVIAARGDKNHVIYKVEFHGKQQEIMITEKNGVWKMHRAQGLIC